MHLSLRRSLSLFLPPLALMGVIFYLSAQPNLDSGLGLLDTILRKGVHMLEFGLLAALWYRALAGGLPLRRPAALLVAAMIAIAYAVTDELHQGSVGGRTSSPFDVGFDSLGVLAAAALIGREQPESALPEANDSQTL